MTEKLLNRKEMTKLSEPILMGLSDKIANTCMLSESELSEVKIKPILKEWKGLAQALEAENKRVTDGIASIIRDSKNDGSYLIVPIRKLLELNQAPTGGGDR